MVSFNVFASQASIALNKSISVIESKGSGRLGVAVLNVKNDEMWSYRGNERFPLLSTFKVLACAKMFKDIETGKLDKNSLSAIYKENLISWSPVTKQLIGQSISVFKACKATMLTSDNTAANIVLDRIGGAAVLTQYLRDIGDKFTRLDRIEPELNTANVGDVRDTTTPREMENTLKKILSARLLSLDSREQLKLWMQNNRISASLLRSVLPAGWRIADRTGAGENGSRAIVAKIWNDEHSYIISIYLTETDFSLKKRNQIVAEVGKEIFKAFLSEK